MAVVHELDLLQVVKYMVRHVSQFPSDNDCYRFIATINDKVSFVCLFVLYPFVNSC